MDCRNETLNNLVLCSLNTLGIQYSSCARDTQVFFLILDLVFICLGVSMQNSILLPQTAHLRVLSVQQMHSAQSAESELQPVQTQSCYQVRLWEGWL